MRTIWAVYEGQIIYFFNGIVVLWCKLNHVDDNELNYYQNLSFYSIFYEKEDENNAENLLSQ